MKWIVLLIAAGFLLLANSADAANVNPSSNDYGGQTVGSISAPVSFELFTSNSSCVPDGMGGCDIGLGQSVVDTSALGGGPGTTTTSGDFVIHNVDCPYNSMTSGPNPSPAQYCHFQVSFLPIAVGARGTTLTFTDTNGPTGSLALSGSGLAPPLPATAGQREAAIKKCKKKFPKGSARRKKCLRHARQSAV